MIEIRGIPCLVIDGLLEWCCIDLSPDWDQLTEIGEERNDQKREFASTRQLTTNPHFDGICGEWAYGMLYGIRPNVQLLVQGDPNPDFSGVEVKTSSYWQDPWLRMFPDDRFNAQCFVLVALNKPDRSARVWGWASPEEIQNTAVEHIPGQGFRHVLRTDQLHKMEILNAK